MDDHLYLIAYDIADPGRWRRVFRVMKGYGEWIQLSVFQARLSRRRRAELIALLDGILHHDHDHLLMVDIGPAENIQPRFTSLGKPFEVLERGPVIV
jgi:CRISPR-associated protein Cas2